MKGKVALVTGSSEQNGIGIAIARSLASRGCSVVLTGSREPEKVESLKEDLNKQYNVPVHYFSANLTDVQAIDKLYGDVKNAFPGGVDILVNNAGSFHFATPVEALPLDFWNRVLHVNLTAPFKLIQLFLPEMKLKGWGRIVNISSVSSMGGFAGSVAYNSSKHGLNGITKTVAVETAGSGVTCNGVCPALVKTSLSTAFLGELAKEKGVPYEEFEKKALSEFNPSGQFVEVEQIGELVAFLCSSAADQMTGANIPIDGGNRAK